MHNTVSLQDKNKVLYNLKVNGTCQQELNLNRDWTLMKCVV